MLVVAMALVSGCTRHPKTFQDSFFAMGSVIEITLVGQRNDSVAKSFEKARAEVERLESILSDTRPSSNVSQLNQRQTDELRAETRFLLERAQAICRETGGFFDVSIRPLKKLWGFGDETTPRIPDPVLLHEARLHVGCDVYEITPEGRLHWNDPAAEIDLGGIAQGYVADRVGASLRQLGHQDFLVNVSGDLVVAGARADGTPWRIGVQHPRRPDSLLVRLPVGGIAVTTSGDYEQYFLKRGRRYHHILDPTTGWPATGLVSVTVWSDDAVTADAYATAVFVLGPVRGQEFLRGRSDVGGLLVTESTTGRLTLHWTDRPGVAVRP